MSLWIKHAPKFTYTNTQTHTNQRRSWIKLARVVFLFFIFLPTVSPLF